MDWQFSTRTSFQTAAQRTSSFPHAIPCSHHSTTDAPLIGTGHFGTVKNSLALEMIYWFKDYYSFYNLISLPIPPSLLPPEPYIQINHKYSNNGDTRNGTHSPPHPSGAVPSHAQDFGAKVTQLQRSPKSRNKATNNSQTVRLLDSEHHDVSSIGSFSMNGDIGISSDDPYFKYAYRKPFILQLSKFRQKIIFR